MSDLLQQVVQPLKHRSTFIYALVDPRNQTFRYIGKSVRPKTRLATHLSPSSLKKNSHKNHWIKSLLRIGLTPQLEIIDEVDYRDDWTVEEKRWIARIRNLAPGYPILTNAGDGGEGVEGCAMPEDIRKKISSANRGVSKSAESRANFSAGQRNRWKNASPQEKQKLLKNLRTPQSLERIEQTKKRARNASKPGNTASRYRNVGLNKQRGRKCWKATCIVNGKQICIGHFFTEEDAARARDRYFLKYIGEDVMLNFPRTDYDNDRSEIVISKEKRVHSVMPKNNTSGLKGIFKNGKNGWAANISYMGIRYRLGTHRTPEQAARAYDRKAIELFGDFARTNFPVADYN